MSEDPLRLLVRSEEDLEVVSAMLQDSVMRSDEISWQPGARRLMLMLRRYRWEASKRNEDGPGERVACALRIDGVLGVRCRGFDFRGSVQVAELLALTFDGCDGCAGNLRVHCANRMEIQADVECLEICMEDLSEPWTSVARPVHRI